MVLLTCVILPIPFGGYIIAPRGERLGGTGAIYYRLQKERRLGGRKARGYTRA